MGRKKITNLFPDYIRTGKADLEVLSQLVLSAKGERSMNDFANECGVNTSTISRIINMKNTTACSDEVLVAISKAADPNSGVTLEKLLAANGMVKLVPAGTEGAVVSPSQIVLDWQISQKSRILSQIPIHQTCSYGMQRRRLPDIC